MRPRSARLSDTSAMHAFAVRRWLYMAILLAFPLAASEGNGVGAHLRIEPADGGYLVYADNPLPGPIEVLLRSRQGGIDSDPSLPARATVPAIGSSLVARLHPPRGSIGSMQLSLTVVPGHPGARPRDVEYLLPLRQPDARIDQGFGGTFSHDDDENRYALDFAADVGTPVLAARAGIVMQAQSGSRSSGQQRSSFDRHANFVRILHDDGSMAMYAHLKPAGVLVRIGQVVEAGQQIGLSGNTGFTTGPHLHFALQVNRGMRLVSIPFRMRCVAMPQR